MRYKLAIFSIVFSPLMIFSQEVIDLGEKREIFVDYFFIEKLDGLSLQMHQPRDEGAVLFLDEVWEGAHCSYSTIIKEDDLYRMYYRGLADSYGDGTEREVTCYAQSKDGIHWEKPVLKLHRYNGSLDNNIILANVPPVTHNFSPFLDANPNVTPSQRFKALGGSAESGLIAFVSSDGIHWQKMQEEAVFKKGEFDSQNVSFWSETEKRYLCYFRRWIGENRTIGMTTSSDFVHWTEPMDMSYEHDPTEQWYTNQTSPYFRAPHIYIAIGGSMMPKRQVVTEEQSVELKVDHVANVYGCSDVFLMSTRGGYHYDRIFMESFIRPAIGINNWLARTNFPVLNVVQTGPTEMSLYVNQDYAQPTAHIRRYSLRLDGFSSLAALYKGGEAITKPFTFSGSELEINYSTSATGDIRFEIQDVNGKPVPGFTLEESAMIIGNEISRIVQWESGKNLKELTGKPVRLRIVMKDADLYSIKFQ